MPTRAPSAIKRATTARPIPEPPPVTSATCPSSQPIDPSSLLGNPSVGTIPVSPAVVARSIGLAFRGNSQIPGQPNPEIGQTRPGMDAWRFKKSQRDFVNQNIGDLLD